MLGDALFVTPGCRMGALWLWVIQEINRCVVVCDLGSGIRDRYSLFYDLDPVVSGSCIWPSVLFWSVINRLI